MELTTAIFSQHPLFTVALVWAVLVAIDWARPPHRMPDPGARVVWLGVGVATHLIFGAIVVWYTTRLAYFDPAEPTITAVSSVFGAGGPLYPALDAPERYVHIYGPMLFLIHASALTLLGPSIIASKMVGGSAILVTVVVSYSLFARRGGFRRALIASALCVLIFLGFGNATFWTRPEPLLLLCAVGALASTHLGRGVPALLLLGVATGVAANLKATGSVYLLPVFAVFHARHGTAALIGAGAVAAAVAVLPFLLPTVSLAHYLDYLQLSATNGLTRLRFEQNVEWAAVLTLPLASVWWTGRLTQSRMRLPRGLLTLLAVSVAILVVVGAKPGGGPYHLLPLVPLFAYVGLMTPDGWEPRQMRRVLLAVAVTAVLIGVPRQTTFLRTMAGRHLETAIADVRRVADAHSGNRIAVGYAGTSFISQARVELVFRSHAYLLDAPAVQEHRLSGLDLPRSTIRAIEECHEDYWLVPRGAEAFDVPSAYWPLGPKDVFPPEFRAAFLRHYERSGETTEFDLWACRAKSAAK